MGNCAGYCNGQNDGDDGHDKVRQSFNKQDMVNNVHNDFENRYGGDQQNKARALGKEGTLRGTVDAKEEVDEYGRVTKGPYTLKNGATYTGQWLDGMRDGYGT